jgi:hypothetical protein
MLCQLIFASLQTCIIQFLGRHVNANMYDGVAASYLFRKYEFTRFGINHEIVRDQE